MCHNIMYHSVIVAKVCVFVCSISPMCCAGVCYLIIILYRTVTKQTANVISNGDFGFSLLEAGLKY